MLRHMFRTARAALLVVAFSTAAPAVATPVPDQMTDRPAAKLRGLDKITARTTTFNLARGQTRVFGTIKVTLRACEENPPTETPESAAFLEIVDQRPDSQPTPVFSGWMFSSSPALSAMEHPIYDVWVLSCADAGDN